MIKLIVFYFANNSKPAANFYVKLLLEHIEQQVSNVID